MSLSITLSYAQRLDIAYALWSAYAAAMQHDAKYTKRCEEAYSAYVTLKEMQK